jgi:hypothetical protein
MDRSTDERRPRGPLPDGSGVLGADDLLARTLARWAADAAVDEAAAARLRTYWLRVQAEEEASVLGTLVDLAERGRPVVVDVAGHRLGGVVIGVGADFVAMRTDRRQQALVPLAAIDVIRAEPGGVDVRGDRTPLLDVALDAVLGPVAAERPTVVVRTTGGAIVRGELRSAGTDVLRLRADGDPPVPTWIPLAAVAVVLLS